MSCYSVDSSGVNVFQASLPLCSVGLQSPNPLCCVAAAISQEPFSRIKKELLRELKGLAPGDRVLLVGCSREPWLAAKKDDKAFMGVWSKALHMPLPDYAARRVSALW
jgi:hypothetical protein